MLRYESVPRMLRYEAEPRNEDDTLRSTWIPASRD